MYRAPELIDQYNSAVSDERSDVWALGCLLYLLASCKHPFQDAGNLSILNHDYHMNEVRLPLRLCDLVRACLLPNTERISLDGMIEVLKGERDVEVTETIANLRAKHAKMKQRAQKVNGLNIQDDWA